MRKYAHKSFKGQSYTFVYYVKSFAVWPDVFRTIGTADEVVAHEVAYSANKSLHAYTDVGY